jgi:hypothetical protein
MPQVPSDGASAQKEFLTFKSGRSSRRSAANLPDMDRLGDAAFWRCSFSLTAPDRSRPLSAFSPPGTVCLLRRSRSRSMNHPVASAATRDAMITPMLTSAEIAVQDEFGVGQFLQTPPGFRRVRPRATSSQRSQTPRSR